MSSQVAGGPKIRAFRSIRAKITIGIVALLLVMTIVTTAVAMERSEDALRNQITLTHEARAKNAAQEIDQALERAKDTARSIAEEPEMSRPILESDLENGTVPLDRLPLKRLLLEHAHLNDPLFEGAMILDPSGDLLMADPFPMQERLLGSLQDPFFADRYHRVAEFTAQVPTPVIHAGGAEETWTVSMRLESDSEVWGVLVIPASTQALGELLGTTQDDTSFFILDHAGTVLMGPAGFPPGTDLSDQKERLQGYDRDSGIITYGDTDYLATLAPLGEDWRLIIAQDSSVAFAPVEAMLTTIILVSGSVIAIGAATGLFVAGRITAPVIRLKQAAERVSKGEYGTQVRTTNKDELAELATAFNTMSARLLEEHERLRRHQENLETTVKERTGELKEANEELEAFVYAASHDLRTPLITLDWLLDELESARREGDEDTLKDTLERMRSNLDGMDRLIEDLLELSRIGRTEGRPQGVMLRPLVEEVLEKVDAHRRHRGTRVHVAFDDNVMVEADPRRMEQVFHNLLSNAIKYGRKGGEVRLRATPIGDPRRPWKWRIEVADDGPGIPTEQRESVFQLFRRGPQDEEDAADGTGIGLAIVRKIIRSYGGEIKAATAPEGGALFWFTLNASRPGASPTEGSVEGETPEADENAEDETPVGAQGPPTRLPGSPPPSASGNA